MSVGACGTDFLGTNDVLIVSFEPAVIRTTTAPSSDDCSDGATVNLTAHTADGETADARVLLWLSGTTVASLSKNSVDVSGGSDKTACLHPGSLPGSVTVHARSGPIETSGIIEIDDHVLAGETALEIIVNAPEPGQPVVGHCGGTACPAQVRQSAITLQATSPTGAPADGANVNLSISPVGYLKATACAANDPADVKVNSLRVVLSGQTGPAFACFDNTPGTATVSARSGGVLAPARMVVVPPIVHGVHLVANRLHPVANDKVTFTAEVQDCENHGVADVPVIISVTQGTFDLDDASPVLARTGSDGSVSFTGTARMVPLGVQVQLLDEAGVECSVSLGGA